MILNLFAVFHTFNTPHNPAEIHIQSTR